MSEHTVMQFPAFSTFKRALNLEWEDAIFCIINTVFCIIHFSVNSLNLF